MLLLLAGPVLAATLPTTCPAIVDGSEVEPYRAYRVAARITSASALVPALRDDWGSADCPAADGAACAGPTGAGFVGTLERVEDHDDTECWSDGIDLHGPLDRAWTTAALTATGLGGSDVSAFGEAFSRYSLDACDPSRTYEYTWDGALAVTGPFGDLRDDAVTGLAAYEWTDWGSFVSGQGAFDGTSGACTWSAAETWYGLSGGNRYVEVTGHVDVDGRRVEWHWSAKDHVTSFSRTTVDGVWTGSAAWATDGVDDGSTWSDGDHDGWATWTDCDDADPTVDNRHGDCDDDGYDQDRDCNDHDPTVRPRAEEVCGDGIDQDCDGFDDGDCDGSDDGDCDDADPTVFPAEDGGCDADCDGWLSSACRRLADCDDTNPEISPGAEEIACNGVDDDCDGGDEEDCDGDGVVLDDCAPADPFAYPGAVEIRCDGVDQDCDGADACPAPASAGCCGAFGAGAAVFLPASVLARRQRRRGVHAR